MNYAVQPEDGVDMSDRIPRIGAYDSLAIEWGYRYFPGLASEEIQEKLSVWIEKNNWSVNIVFRIAVETYLKHKPKI